MTAVRPKSAVHSSARRRARAIASLLLATTSFGCAGQLADELTDEADETVLGEREEALEAIAAPDSGVVVKPVGTVTMNPIGPLGPITDGGVSVLLTDGGLVAPKPPITITPKPPVATNPPMSIDLEEHGTLLCSRTALKLCGTEKADYVGAYQLDLSCDAGFYDPIYGGTCWTCPTDDSRGSWWIRTLDPVDKDTACHREGYAPAKRVKSSTPFAWDCPSDTFWDGWDGGGCWTCPADRARRTLEPVYSAAACATWGLETAPARLLRYNGCPTPNAQTMGLKGQRKPGNAFLDIAGGWSQGVASGGCYACPISDAEGNILITDRNANPIYGDNQGCDVLFKYKPTPFTDPGLSGMPRMGDFLLGSGLLEPKRLNAELYLLAAARGLTGSAQASWVAAQLKEMAARPYANESIRTLVFAQIVLAARKSVSERTPAEATVLATFESYLNRRRVHIAQTGLEMYDAWKAASDDAKSKIKQSTLMAAFDFGTVPFNFHQALSTGMTLGAMGSGVGGSLAAVMKFSSAVNTADKAGYEATTLFGLAGMEESGFMRPINLFAGGAAAGAALAGTTVITVAFAIIQSVAISQLIEIETARPKLQAALDLARRPVTLAALLRQDGGTDQALYWWSKAMETGELEDHRVVAALAGLKSPTAAGQVDQRLALLDATFYLNKYPDLKATFGSDLEKAKSHFLVNGIKEGRDASATFSIGAYLARYTDLQKAFGSDYEAAYNHWFTYGKKENRNTNPTDTYMADARAAQLDPIFYANEYPDLKQAFGYKVPLLVRHWLSYGIAEKRIPNATVKP